jgi:hypothetical protein
MDEEVTDVTGGAIADRNEWPFGGLIMSQIFNTFGLCREALVS